MAMIKLRDGRELDVVETVEELKDVIMPTGGAAAPALVEVTEVRRVVKRKFPTPIDTKAEFVEQEIKHLVAVAHIVDVQPLPHEVVDDQDRQLLPVHDRVHAHMQAVSGPFKHDFDQHVVECEEVDGRLVDKARFVADAACLAADPHGVKTKVETDDVQ